MENDNNLIHQSAIIDKGATLGKNCKIWHWVHICEGAVIGDNCSLGQNVFIANEVKIGNNVKIQNNVSIYDKVFLSNNVFCGPSMVFTNVINPRSAINRKEEYKSTIVEEGVSFGANSTIICGIRIGKYAFIGAGSLVNKNVKPFSIVVGVPAKQVGWMSIFGERINLPLQGSGQWKCPKTGIMYTLNGEILSCI